MANHDDDMSMEMNLKQSGKSSYDLKPFICMHPGCGKSFADQPALTRHNTVSHGTLAFACTYPGCERRFHDAAKLRRHHNAHKIRDSTFTPPES